MALFTKKTWKNRMSEYPTRRRLTKENGTTELVTVARSEGTVSQEGDAFSADNMNNLEDRILRAIGTGDIPKELGADIVSAINALNTGLDDFIAKSTPIRAVAGDLFNTTYGNGWYYFADKSANTPETYGLCFFLNINNWSFRLAIGTSKFAYTNVNIGQGFGTWLKL